MLNDYQAIDALVSGVTETTRFLSRFLSRKFGFIFLLIGLGAIISKFLLG